MATTGRRERPVSDLQSSRVRRVLVGGVGYHNLRDLSFGPLLVEELRREEWPDGVEIEDLSYGPIGIMHNLDARAPYERMVLVAGVRRGRVPGAVTCYRWDRRLPKADELQARIAEAGSGVVSLDNLLIVGTWFGKLPEDVAVVEVEAADEGWGEGFTREVEAAIPEAVRRTRECALEPFPEAPDAGRSGGRTLVAGFGSVLLGDDGFGVRVVERLASERLPDGVELLEVGTGGIELVVALKRGFSDLIVVDAVRRGVPPGTVCSFRPERPGGPPQGEPVDPHFTEPTRAMGLAASLGILPERVTVIGCEPASCELGLELSPAVGAAVDAAAAVIRGMVGAGAET